MVGEEAKVSESIAIAIVAGLIGVFGTVFGALIVGFVGIVGTLVNHYLRQRERKSERRRELYERDLSIVLECADAVTEAWAGTLRSWVAKPRIVLLEEAAMLLSQARLMTDSIDGLGLEKDFDRLLACFSEYLTCVDEATGRLREGKDKEALKWIREMRDVISEILRRRRQFLEGV